MDLLLVRHGVSEHNTSDVISGGTSNPNLSQAGVKQVEGLYENIYLSGYFLINDKSSCKISKCED